MNVFIVILNFNGYKETVECLHSVLLNKPSDRNITIVVVDNGSADDSVKVLKRDFKDKIVLLENKENLGFTGGCNTGMKYALSNGADCVVLLNNDTIVDKNLIKNLTENIESSKIGGVVPKIYFEKGHEFHKEYKKQSLGKVIWYAGGEMDWANIIGKNIGVDEVDGGQFDERKETGLATGCCFLIKSEVLKKVGIFDDKFFLYYEDADLTERIKKAGYSIIYEPKAVLWHKNAASTGGSGSKLQDYFISRNRMLFGLRYAPLRSKVAIIRESLRLLKNGREWQKKGIEDYYKRRFGKGTFMK